MRTDKLKPKITRDNKKGDITIAYTITAKKFSEMVEADTGYRISQEVHTNLARMVSDAFFEKHKDDLLKQITFDDLKSILLMTASKELMQKLTEMTGNRNY